jgi:hypothetical protein
MANIQGYVTVYESSDAGTGDPRLTFWQFFVDPGNKPRQAVTTKNDRLADTMRLAINTNSRVSVSYDPTKGNAMEQARIEFNYICELVKIEECKRPSQSMNVCVTRRYSSCDPAFIPRNGRRRQRK